MRMPRLDGELVSGSRVRERQLPATGEPLDQDERPEGHLPAHLVASFLCLRLELLQDLAGSVEVAHHHQPPPEHVTRAEVPFELELELLLDLEPTFEEARRDHRVVLLRPARIGDRLGEESGIAGPLGPCHRLAAVGQRSVAIGLDQVMARANGENPGAAGLVCPGFRQRLIDLLEQLGRIFPAA